MSLDVESRIRNINSRIGWRITRNILGKECGITAQGLSPFIERMLSQTATDQSLEKKIDDFWRGLIFSGTRLLKIFPLTSSEMSKVQASLLAQSPDSSLFNHAYPAPLSTHELHSADMELHFAEVSDTLYGETQLISSVILSKAYYTEIIELDGSHLSDAGMQLKAEGGEIKCKRREITQCFHNILLIPSKNILIMSVDLSSLPRGESAPQQVLLEAFIRNIAKIRLSRPLDLFPAIASMYDSVDGRISAMTFLTGDGNGSSLKLKPSQQCLKRDSYHKGGVSAGSVLTKFRLGKTWDVTIGGTNHSASIELTLPGKRAMLDDPKKHLFEAIITDCPTLSCVLFAIERLMDSLPAISTEE